MIGTQCLPVVVAPPCDSRQARRVEASWVRRLVPALVVGLASCGSEHPRVVAVAGGPPTSTAGPAPPLVVDVAVPAAEPAAVDGGDPGNALPAPADDAGPRNPAEVVCDVARTITLEDLPHDPFAAGLGCTGVSRFEESGQGLVLCLQSRWGSGEAAALLVERGSDAVLPPSVDVDQRSRRLRDDTRSTFLHRSVEPVLHSDQPAAGFLVSLASESGEVFLLVPGSGDAETTVDLGPVPGGFVGLPCQGAAEQVSSGRTTVRAISISPDGGWSDWGRSDRVQWP